MANMVNAAGVNSGRAAIFDLDGTLLDSMGVWDAVDVEFLGRRGFDVPADYMQKVSAMQFHDIAAYTIRRFGLDDTPEELMREWNDLAYEAYTTTVELKPGARAYLEWLRASGARLAVATSMLPHCGSRRCVMRAFTICSTWSWARVMTAAAARTTRSSSSTRRSCSASSQHIAPCSRICSRRWNLRNAPACMCGECRMTPRPCTGNICETADGVLFDFNKAPRQLT